MTNGSDLRREVDRLTFDLQQACQEKVQAAEYGLAVLEEKQKLQESYDELQASFEKVRYELSQANEQISLLQTKNESLTSKVDAKQGNIVQECTTRESAFASKVSELQLELKSVKKSERSTFRETETLKQQLLNLQKNHDSLNDERKQLLQDLKDRKVRESQFNDEYNLLEDENTSLQKAVSKLKQTLVEYEGLKVENKSLFDEVDSLQLQLQVTSGARDQFEKQVHEAMDSLKEQRERHAQYQKEIHELKQQSIMRTWNMEVKDFSENPIIKQITEELRDETPVPAGSGMVDDLLKELQFTEMRELEEQLRVVNKEKQDLAEELSKKQSSASSHGKSNGFERENAGSPGAEEGDEYTMNNKLKELAEFKETVKQLSNREEIYKSEIQKLKEESEELKKLHLSAENEKETLLENSKGESKSLSDEVLSLKSKLRDAESKVRSLENEVSSLKEMAGETQGSLKSTVDDLKNMCNDVIRLNEYISQPSEENNSSKTTTVRVDKTQKASPEDVSKLITQMKEQLRMLQMTLGKLLSERSTNANSSAQLSEQAQENLQLKGQLLKLQTLVATKREQISTLRTVLKANKSTYEVALANLKSRYENDKDVQSETNAQLKRQIKALKSECLTFTSMRTMFAERCDEYMKQLLEKEQAIKAAEEEKRTLNNLLKSAIQQKIAVKQKLEEFEIARERLRQFTRKNIKAHGKEGSAGGSPKPVTRV